MDIWSNVHACFFMPFQVTAGLFRYCLNVSLRARTCNPTHSLNKHCWQCAVPLSEKIGHVLSKGTVLSPCPTLSFHDTSRSLSHRRSIETLHFMVYSEERGSWGHSVHMSVLRSVRPWRGEKKKNRKGREVRIRVRCRSGGKKKKRREKERDSGCFIICADNRRQREAKSSYNMQPHPAGCQLAVTSQTSGQDHHLVTPNSWPLSSAQRPLF